MLHLKSLLTSVLFFLICGFTLVAQTGSIKGTIKDAKTNEPLIGAAVAIQGTTNGSITDVEGNFLIAKAPVGKLNISITYISYQTKLIEVTVEAGKQIILNTALDEDAGQTLQEVVVTASRATNTEVAVISEIKSIQQVAVGVSAQQIIKSQDRDAAQVARRVPGVSIIDNRFVLIRGLSQRYNTVMINDVIAPSTEVDSRAFSFDMLPSSIIDRFLIFKSGAAELPGEFAGGVIKVYTRSAPEENFTNVGISASYRNNTTFQEVQKAQGGPTDYLGFDNGDRSIPNIFPSRAELFNLIAPEQRAGFANQLPNKWGVSTQNAPLDLRLSFNIGRRFNWGGTQIGNLTSINYSSTNQFADVDFNTFRNGDMAGARAASYKDSQFIHNARLGILHNWFFRFGPKFTLEFKNLYNQLGFAETVVRNGQDIDDNNDVRSYSQRYESRSIYSGQLIGKHNFSDRFTASWIAGFGYTHREEPDWRRLRYTRPTGETGTDGQLLAFSAQTDGLLSNAARFFSTLDETALTASVNTEYKLKKAENEENVAKLSAGFYIEDKNRDFAARWFGYTGGDQQLRRLPIQSIFSASNVTGQGNTTFTITEGTQQNDKYKAGNRLYAGYLGAFLPVGQRFNVTAGLRMEFNDQTIRSKPNPISGLTQDIDVSNAIASPLPSLNMTYELSEKQLVRLAYSYTINRPELRELAPFQYFDFNYNANIEGNEKLKIARVQNIDFRWEYYPSPSELISFGGFYKYFQNPIENFLPQRNTPSNLDYTFINAKNATSYGVEAEVRKSFLELSSRKFIQNLAFVANASYIVSRISLGDFVTLPSAISPEPYDVRGITETRRPMMNQSPYLINAGLYYNDEESGVQANILYNVFGKRIYAVGNILSPTIYEMPRNVIDITFSKTFNKQWEVRAGIQDVLNQRFRLEQDYNRDSKINDSDNQTIRSYRRGSYFTLGVVYHFVRRNKTANPQLQ